MEILVGIIVALLVIGLIVEYWAEILVFILIVILIRTVCKLSYNAISPKYRVQVSIVAASIAFWTPIALAVMERRYIINEQLDNPLVWFICVMVCPLAIFGIVSGLFMAFYHSIGNTHSAFGRNVKFSRLIEDNSYGIYYHSVFSYVFGIVRNVLVADHLCLKEKITHSDPVFMVLSLPFLTIGLLTGWGLLSMTLFAASVILSLPFLALCSLYFVVFGFSDWTLHIIRRLSDICPHCHRRVTSPIYICPNCGRTHEHLGPSVKLGSFFHKCQCGRRLPVSRLLGRDKLRTVCPSCKQTLLGSVHKPFTIALIGSPSAGKSQLVLKLLASLSRDKGTVTGYEVSKNSIEYCLRKTLVMVLVALGQKKMKQEDPKEKLRDIDALCLNLSRKEGNMRSRVYVCDPPGEAFESAETLSSHRYYANMDFALLVIDPLSLPAIRKRSAENAKPVTSSIISPEDCFNRWLICMNKNFHGIAGKVKCAVVLSKCDKLASVGITNIRAGASEGECKEFLREYAGDNMVRLIENTFPSVNFFAVSAIGDDDRVDQVAVWLLAQIGVSSLRTNIPLTLWQKITWAIVGLTFAFGAYVLLSERIHTPTVGEGATTRLGENEVEAAEQKLKDIKLSIEEEDRRRAAAERAARESFEQGLDEVKHLSKEFGHGDEM